MTIVRRQPSKAKFKQFSDKGTEDLAKWREVFVHICDPTEYGAAIELAGSWEEWQRMKREWPEFRTKILVDWLAEVEVKRMVQQQLSGLLKVSTTHVQQDDLVRQRLRSKLR